MEDLERQHGESNEDYKDRLRKAAEDFKATAEQRAREFDDLVARLDTTAEVLDQLKDDNEALRVELRDERERNSSSTRDQRTHEWWRDIAHEARTEARKLREEVQSLMRQLVTAQATADSWQRMYEEEKGRGGEQGEMSKFLMTFIAAQMADKD